MFSIEAYIDENKVVDKLIKKNYSDEAFSDFIELIRKMNGLNDEVYIGNEQIIKVYDKIANENTVNNNIFMELIYRGQIKYKDIYIEEIYKTLKSEDKFCSTLIIELDEKELSFNHIISSESLTLIARRLLEFENQVDFVEMLQRCFEKCIFSETVPSSVRRISRNKFNENKRNYIHHLSILNDDAFEIWEKEECTNNTAFCTIFQSATGISNSPENVRSTAEYRYFLFNWRGLNDKGEIVNYNEKVQCEKHTKIEIYGKDAQRIYFEFKDTGIEKNIMIGYIGNHLSSDSKEYSK